MVSAIKSAAVLLLLSATLGCAQTASELQARGDALDEKNQSGDALALYLAADKLQPNNAEILRREAKEYLQMMLDASSPEEKKLLGNQALDLAQRAVKADPNNGQAHLTVAIVYGRLAQTESARRKVEMSKLIHDESTIAARLDPDSDYAWHVLGRWNYEMANLNPLLKILAQAVYGKFPEASNEKACECLEKAAALNPRRVVHQIELGRAYLAMGRKKEARAALEKGLALPSVAKDDNETKERGRLALKQLN